MTEPLLIEIGVEELPAIPLLAIVEQIETLWQKQLEEADLLCAFSFHYTPRRLVLWHPEFPINQPDREEELFGPPTAIAFKAGVPTRAAEGFAKKSGVPLEAIGRGTKSGKEVLYVKKMIPGKPSRDLIEAMLDGWLKAMPFGKMMRWGEGREAFIRPLRWIFSMMGPVTLSLRLFGVESGNATRVHRQVSTDPVASATINAYFDTLAGGGVILYAQERRRKVLEGFAVIEQEYDVQIGRDDELLNEVIAITEFPTPLLGLFDAHFLQLPPEVIMTSMKEHQRYFPVFKAGKLHHAFIVVSNAKTDDFSKIVQGNERVLRPRLSDAKFFYDNDLKNGWNTEGLDAVIFMQGAGSLKQKSVREGKIAEAFLECYAKKLASIDGSDVNVLKPGLARTAAIGKADLLSEMVYEFTELQGIMGSYYARALGEEEAVARAIREQYLPEGEESELPETPLGILCALALRWDNLMMLFSIGKIPTGSRDPFGLRRAVNGIIRIVVAYGLPFDMTQMIERFSGLYAPFEHAGLEQFIEERLYAFIALNPSIVKAVLAGGERDIKEIVAKCEALGKLIESEAFKEGFATFKRVANICKDLDTSGELRVDPSHFASPWETRLYEAYSATEQTRSASYEARLDALVSLKPILDDFFDNVMVNAEEEALRVNRKNLVGLIYLAFRRIADIKEISV